MAMVTTEGSEVADAPIAQLLVFLIADVRGYTRFTNENGDEAAARLATRFADIADEIVSAHDGRVIELRGDEALAVFVSARSALRAAVAMQARYAQEAARDPSLPLRVGIGIDAGEAIPVKGGYRGGALNLAARLCSTAGPGDVFASEGAVHLARKMDGIVAVARGEVQLKGLANPVPVFQVGEEGMVASDAPPLQAPASNRSNLPQYPTAVIRREREVAAVCDLLSAEHVRLLTLLGPGGTGKTRLAVEVGEALLHVFPDGVYFVPLDAIVDPQLVPSAIASALGVTEETGVPLLDTLQTFLRDKGVLLILDNFEQVLDAAPQVMAILSGVTRVKVLVTSQAVLHVYGEHSFDVPPLDAPNPADLPDLDVLAQTGAVALFVERARASKPGFMLTADNARPVAEICWRLDGMPLAIELAAARVRILPPPILLSKLASTLKILTGGSRGAPGRQQTLRGAIDWSYNLLDDEQRRLLSRLSVFSGGCTLEMAEMICNAEGDLDVIDGIESLVEKSLLRQHDGDEPRFAMLSAIREYAEERLTESGEAELLRRVHAEQYSALAGEAEAGVTGSDQAEVLDRLEREHENFRSALRWTEETAELEVGLRLASSLCRFWQVRGHLSEGRTWLQHLLELANALGSVSASDLAKALDAAGALAYHQGDPRAAIALREESLALRRELGAERELVSTLNGLAAALHRHGDMARATELYQESLALARRLRNARGIVAALTNLGNVALENGEYEPASALYDEALALCRSQGDGRVLALILMNCGNARRALGDVNRGAALYEESLALARDLGDKQVVAMVLANLASIRHESGDRAGAAEYYTESIRLGRELDAQWLVSYGLEGIATLTATSSDLAIAAQVFGASAMLRDVIQVPLAPNESAAQVETIAGLRAGLGEAAFASAWAAGQRMTPEEAIAMALRASEACSTAVA